MGMDPPLALRGSDAKAAACFLVIEIGDDGSWRPLFFV